MYGLGPSPIPAHNSHENSPPVSNGSCDSVDASSGHDSPHVLSGEITSTVGYSTPIPNKGDLLQRWLSLMVTAVLTSIVVGRVYHIHTCNKNNVCETYIAIVV